jgi:hypothetical protein
VERSSENPQTESFVSSSTLSKCLPIVDEVRTFFENMSEEIADIIAAIQGVMAV